MGRNVSARLAVLAAVRVWYQVCLNNRPGGRPPGMWRRVRKSAPIIMFCPQCNTDREVLHGRCDRGHLIRKPPRFRLFR